MKKLLHHFDPDFDDTTWTDAWGKIELVIIPSINHHSNYRIEQVSIDSAEVFGKAYNLSEPVQCCKLFDQKGVMWMSDTPQERIMMYNNARKSKGHTLVGGLGLGTFVQYAQAGAVGKVDRFTIIEKNEIVIEMVLPTIEKVLNVPFDIVTDDIKAFLSREPVEKYDTIFIDTWETLDAANLPAINSLRNQSLQHVQKKGKILLWGYRWMLRLFEDACKHIFDMDPEIRKTWAIRQIKENPRAAKFISPVVSFLEEHNDASEDEMLKWCLGFIVNFID